MIYVLGGMTGSVMGPRTRYVMGLMTRGHTVKVQNGLHEIFFKCQINIGNFIHWASYRIVVDMFAGVSGWTSVI